VPVIHYPDGYAKLNENYFHSRGLGIKVVWDPFRIIF
jgi:hypothetical protein